MTTPLSPPTWNGKFFYQSTTTQPTAPPPGVTSPGAWAMNRWTVLNKTQQVCPAMFVWVPPALTPTLVSGGSGQPSVVEYSEGLVYPYTHMPWGSDYSRTDLAPLQGWAFVDGNGNGQAVNTFWVGSGDGPLTCTDFRGNVIDLPQVGTPSGPPPGYAAGGQWYGSGAALYAYSVVTPVPASNLGLWLLVGGGVAAAGTAAAYL